MSKNYHDKELDLAKAVCDKNTPPPPLLLSLSDPFENRDTEEALW